MPQSGHQKPTWSSGKAELGVCEPASASICAAELASRGEAVVSKNTLRILPELLGQTGEIIAESTERRWMMLAQKKSTYVMLLPLE